MNQAEAMQIALHMKSIVPASWEVSIRNTARSGRTPHIGVKAFGPGSLEISCYDSGVFYVYNDIEQDHGIIRYKEFQQAWDAMVATVVEIHAIVVEQYNGIKGDPNVL